MGEGVVKNADVVYERPPGPLPPTNCRRRLWMAPGDVMHQHNNSQTTDTWCLDSKFLTLTQIDISLTFQKSLDV